MLHPEAAAAPSRTRILLIEDEVLLRALVADELREFGFTVVEASRPDEAQAYLSAGGQADLVISDVRMPGRVDGLEFCRQLRNRNPALPIILVSGNIGPRAVQDVGRFVAKPFIVDDLIALVFELLDLKNPGRTQ